MTREDIVLKLRLLGPVLSSMEARHPPEEKISMSAGILADWGDLMNAAAAELEREAVDIPIFDREEIYRGCTVQVLRNSYTGETSVGWWKEGSGEPEE